MTGEVIVNMHQHSCYGKNKTICSSTQIDHYKNIVDHLSIKVSGGQNITTLDKHKTLMCIRGKLPYMTLSHYTDKECVSLPHFMLTSDA